MGGEAPPADLDPWQAPEGEVPENAGSEVPDDPPERPDGEMEPDGRESPAGGRGPGGGEGGQSAAGLSKTFTLSDGGSFFNGSHRRRQQKPLRRKDSGAGFPAPPAHIFFLMVLMAPFSSRLT